LTIADCRLPIEGQWSVVSENGISSFCHSERSEESCSASA